MKRIISLTLVFIVAFVNLSLPLSAETLSPSLFDVITIVGLENLSEIFGDGEVFENGHSLDATIGRASIDYDMSVHTPFKGEATASITLWINGKISIVDVSGTMTATLVSGIRCWEGCLQGNLTVAETVYENVLVGIIKFDNDDRFSVTITIPSASITVIGFNNLIISDQVAQQMNANINRYTPAVSPENLIFDNAAQNDIFGTNDVYQPIPGSEFSIIGNAFTSFYDARYPNMIPYYDQRARAFYAKGPHRLAVSFKSYCGTLRDYFVQNRLYPDETYVTGVSRVTMKLDRLGGTSNHTHIVGIEKQTLLTSFSNSAQQNLAFTVFLDLLNMLGVPTNTVQAYLENLQGGVNVNVGTDTVEIDIFAPTTDYYDFDSIEQGIPIIAQLAGSDIYNCWGTYAYSTSAIYKTRASRVIYEPMTHIPQWITWDICYNTQVASSTVTVDVSMNW